MAGNQKRLIVILFLLNLLVWGGGYAAWRLLPDYESTALALLQMGSSPTAVPRSVPPTPTRSPQPVAVATPTRALTTQRPAAPRALPLAAATSLPQPRAVPAGVLPSTPLVPGDAWQTLTPGASVWYRIGKGGDHIDARLEAKPLDGMAMDVFAPGNLERPIGRGTLQRGTDGLAWSGGHWDSAGDWLAKITNGSPASVQYRVVSATNTIGTCDSISYWETLGGAPVYWTRCK